MGPLAATYDPDPRLPLGFRIPFNAETCAAIPERWRQWRYLYLIHYGSRLLSQWPAGLTRRGSRFLLDLGLEFAVSGRTMTYYFLPARHAERPGRGYLFKR